MRKGIVALLVLLMVVAAGVAGRSLSAPVLDEDVEYELTSFYYQGREVSAQVDEDDLMDLLEGASRGLITRGGLPGYASADAMEVNLLGDEEPLRVVLSLPDALYAVYQDADWSYTIRDGEALAEAVQALLPE